MSQRAGVMFAITVAASIATAADTPAEFFEKKVRPVLVRCSACHGDKVQMGSLQLTTAEGVSKGAASGPVVVKGRPEESPLIHAVSYLGKVRMPPTGKLADEEIQALRDWIKMGAPWPQTSGTAPVSAADKAKHWAFQPVSDPEPPTVKDRGWLKNPIDNFIAAKREEKGLAAAKPADKLTLLRRAKFDLHGLPPTEQEIDEFVADKSSDAFAKLLDRLLSSPRYGEHWGRRWLDIVRYADDPEGWRYRDYVIRSFNQDLPYNRFVVEQLAGDQLPVRSGTVNEDALVATGFLALGPKALEDSDKKKLFYDVVDEQIDVTAKAFMALTISCSRCHDHKFDPITTKDYYSMASIFASTQIFEKIDPVTSTVYRRPLVSADVYAVFKVHDNKVKAKEAQIEAVLDLAVTRYKDSVLQSQTAKYLLAARKVRVDKLPLEQVAHEDKLDAEVLANWVTYLKPGFRPFLQKWHKSESNSDMAAVQALANEYQQGLRTTAGEWIATLQKWSDGVDEAVRTGAAPPAKPEFLAFKNRFFSEVSLAFGTYQEGIAKGPFAVPQADREKMLSADLKQRVEALRAELTTLKAGSPPEPAMGAAVGEDRAVEQHVLVRGSYENLGDIVPKRFPVALAGTELPALQTVSGRKEMAEWLVRPDHLLTGRVMVNRIWQGHFAEGLVRTPNNFGIVGEKPSHPELLDYLSRQFIKSGWSVKAMHRMIMLSSTYQMSSEASENALKADGDNRLLTRFPRRRLAIEEMRDAFLAVSGALDLTVGGNLQTGGRRSRPNAEDFVRRTVYVPVNRTNIPGMLSLFDFGDAFQSWGKRSETNTAPQSLYLMNNPFVHTRAEGFAKLVLSDNSGDDAARIGRAYRVALGRGPQPEEVKSALDFIEKYPTKEAAGSATREAAWISFCKMLMASNEFHFVN